MAIHSFLKAEKGDPDWQFSPDQYFGKEFKIVDASSIELSKGVKEMMVLRQNPTDKKLLAKHIKIEAKEDSHLDLLIINDAEEKLQQIFLYDVHLKENSTVNFGIFVKDGKFNKHIIQVSLEEGADFNSFGLMTNDVGGDTEIITKIIHQHNQTSSRQFIISRAGDSSQTVYQGMVALESGSEGSSAHIENMNLVTSNGRCYSKPEIYSNVQAVKSTIGSITEHLDAEKIYYLQSRGLSPNDAVQAVIQNFQNSAISLVNFEDLKEEITQMFS
jgi:Fe-S cluster assembly scaffold protein SufB